MEARTLYSHQDGECAGESNEAASGVALAYEVGRVSPRWSAWGYYIWSGCHGKGVCSVDSLDNWTIVAGLVRELLLFQRPVWSDAY